MNGPVFDRRALMQAGALASLLAAAGGAQAAEAGAPLMVIAEITAKPDQADAFRALVIPFAASTRGEPGCLHYTLLEDAQTPGHFFTYEAWSSPDALTAHMQSPNIQALGAKAGAMLAKPPAQTMLKTLSNS